MRIASMAMISNRILLFVLVISFEECTNVQVLRAFKLQKARDKCKEYSEFAQRDVELLSLLPFAKPTILKVPHCDHPAEPLIVGGKPAANGEFPHMAAIGFKGENNELVWNCGGTLISERFILTAAHCATSRNGLPVKVRLGTINLNQTKRQEFGIAKIIVHPSFSPRRKYNDIALLKLDRNVTISINLRPACLWQNHSIATEKGIATGWGLTEHAGPKSMKLLKVLLKFFENEKCQSTYASTTRGLRSGIVGNMVCAGDLDGGKDTCNGDSGGPLVITKDDNRCVYYTVGVTSFGKSCGIPNTPAVYTRVSSFIEWIVDNVWEIK